MSERQTKLRQEALEVFRRALVMVTEVWERQEFAEDPEPSEVSWLAAAMVCGPEPSAVYAARWKGMYSELEGAYSDEARDAVFGHFGTDINWLEFQQVMSLNLLSLEIVGDVRGYAEQRFTLADPPTRDPLYVASFCALDVALKDYPDEGGLARDWCLCMHFLMNHDDGLLSLEGDPLDSTPSDFDPT